MKNLATWCVLAAVAAGAAGWGLLEAASPPRVGGSSKKTLPPKKTEPQEGMMAKAVGDANKKGGDAPVKSPYALYGEEAALCMDRFHATLADRVTEMNKFWWTTMPKGKVAQEEWQAMANALCEDLELYGRSAVDAVKDARKDKKSRASEADVARLKAQVEKTIKFADHVFRKKGLEVAIYRDAAQRAAATMLGFKSSMPMILSRLWADLAYASDLATGVHNDLQGGMLTKVELDQCMRSLELARRSTQAVKAVGMVRRATLAVTLKAMAPELMLAACQKAIENWVPPDLTADTLLTAKQTEDIQAWPALVEQAFGKGYAPVFEEGRKAVSPLVDATFHQTGLFKTTALADLDKALAPFINECKAVLEARQALEASQKDAEQAEKLADEELKTARSIRQKSGEAARLMADKIKEVQVKVLYEADRRRYHELFKKFTDLQGVYEKLGEKLEQKEKELQTLKQGRFAAKFVVPQLKTHVDKATMVRVQITMLRSHYDQVVADLEEVFDEIHAMRAQMRGEGLVEDGSVVP